MNKLFRLCCATLGAVALLTTTTALGAGKPDAWRVLFDGKNTSAWRTFGGADFPKEGWEVKDGCLHLKPDGKGGELVTRDAFDNYEFEWEWRIAPKGNNGIKYLVTEARPHTPGPEYQMVDDSTMNSPRRQTAAFYEVLPLQVKTTVHPPGKWNRSRLIVRGDHVEHWLNGVKVLAYELGSAAVKAGVANSKFRDIPDFDKKIRGHILLTNHHSEAWYRKVRIRELPAP